MKVLISGYGRMGRLIEKTLISAGDEVVGRIDIDSLCVNANTASDNLNVCINSAADLENLPKIADIIMDFSNPSLSDQIMTYAKRTSTPLLSGTTNMSAAQHETILALGEAIPVIWASNYSLGINLFMHILPQVAAVIGDWDIEISETHHNKKVDSPSGTAKSLADAIDPEARLKRVYGRSGNCGERSNHEIGMHALRGGNVTGEHKVDFFGNDEVFEITHKAGSRQILVDGAIAAARKLITREPGLYDMEKLLFDM